ncbi:vang-like protein 2 isoform X2 [Cimex lectularius]|uniref:Vang-like protein n=1 Tax=Cimex lectularius TaxID=79782 RepID=A0A8I6R7M1_CIMLE|nr:vang-like protein 2 isoform X2 [Cimex lectularius]
MYGISDIDMKPAMEATESLKSLNENSTKTKRSRSHNHRSSHRSYSHKNSRNREDENMAPFQTAVTVDETRNGQEVIEVQILPQDDNWGENTTAVTGNTSDQSGSVEEVNLWPSEPDAGIGFTCSRYVSTAIAILLSFVAFVSPILMLILPKIGFFPSLGASLSAAERAQLLSCGAECKGLLVSLCFKLLLLAAGAWAVFLRKSRATLPCIFMFRAAVLLLVFICCFTYWLFYIVQITEGARESVTSKESLEYRALVAYAASLTDTLLFIHYLAVILIEIRHLQPSYYVKIVRSPDGESKSYAIGQLSIQRAAVWILDKYYTEFQIYNPYLERIPVSKSRKPTSSFKYYEVDGVNTSTLQNQNRSVTNSHARRRDSSHNERFYEEHDYERRVKKRRARLITAAEEAFTHIKRLHHEPAPGLPMDSHEAAQAVFPSLARALQKYLRVTRQQPRHSVDSILQHLAQCLSHDLSPRAFLERFLQPAPVLQNEKEQKEVQSWSLICDEALSQPVKPGTVFQLRQNDVSLFCSIHMLPHFNITEEVIDPASNRVTRAGVEDKLSVMEKCLILESSSEKLRH